MYYYTLNGLIVNFHTPKSVNVLHVSGALFHLEEYSTSKIAEYCLHLCNGFQLVIAEQLLIVAALNVIEKEVPFV